MSGEESKALLDSVREAGSLAKRVKTSKAIPKEFRLALTKYIKNGEPGDYRSRAKDGWQSALGLELGGLSKAKLAALVGALLPTVQSEVLQALQSMQRQTYLESYERRPFRCPGSKAQLDRLRASWLLSVTMLLGDYPVDSLWCAEHGQNIAYGADRLLGWLMVGALELQDSGSLAIMQVFSTIAAGELAGGEMTAMLVRGCLLSDRPEAWDLVERTLLAAQRQEGLRQTILESVDEAHPEAFVRMLRLIQEHKLSRFSSVIHAVDVWFGFHWDGESKFAVDKIVEQVAYLVEDQPARAASLASEDPEEVYMGLWSTAYLDIDKAIECASGLLPHPNPEIRYAATHLLAQSTWTAADELLVLALGDGDMRVVQRALQALTIDRADPLSEQAFCALEALLERLPEKATKLPAAIWPWTAETLTRTSIVSEVFDLVTQERLNRFLPFTQELVPWERSRAMEWLTGASFRWAVPPIPPRRLEGEVYSVVLGFLADPSPDVREAAFRGLKKTPVMKEEVQALIGLLRRKASDLRSQALQRLRLLPDPALLEVAQTLCGNKLIPRRLAGLELARHAFEDGRISDAASELAQDYRV